MTSFTGLALPANTYVCGITTDTDNVEIVSILVCSPVPGVINVAGITAVGFVVSVTRVPESSGELYVPDGIDADLGYASRFVVNETRQKLVEAEVDLEAANAALLRIQEAMKA